MRRAVGLAIVGLLALGTTTTAHALTWQQRKARVRFETVFHPQWTYDETVWTIRWSADRFHVSASTMLCIGHRESGSSLDEDAVNDNGGPGDALGLFQHLRRYWDGRVHTYNAGVGRWLKVQPNASPFSARANALVTARMMHTGGLGPWGGSCP